MYVCIVGDRSWGLPEGSLFNSYYTEGWALLLSQVCSTLPLIHTFHCWVLSKEVSSTIFKVFGMTRPGIEPRFPGPLANTLPTRISLCFLSSPASVFFFFFSTFLWSNPFFLSSFLFFFLIRTLPLNIPFGFWWLWCWDEYLEHVSISIVGRR